MSASLTPLETVTTFLDHMAVKDYDDGLRYIAADCVYHNMPMARLIGPEGVRAVLEPFFAPTIDNEFVILRTVIEGDMVVTERLDRHLIATGWVELPVTGIWQVRDGQIVMWHEYFDAATIQSKWPS